MEQIASSRIADSAEELLAPVVGDCGFELLLCEVVGGGRGPILRVYIERSDGTSVGIQDCVAVNDAVTDLLDTADLVPRAYNLEVSSPGLERPLKRPAHFSEHLGQRARLRTWEPIGERKNWTGVLADVEGDLVTIRLDEGTEHRIPIPALERAHLVYVPEPKGQKRGGNTKNKKKRS